MITGGVKMVPVGVPLEFGVSLVVGVTVGTNLRVTRGVSGGRTHRTFLWGHRPNIFITDTLSYFTPCSHKQVCMSFILC